MTHPGDRQTAAGDFQDAAQDWFIRLASGDASEKDVAAFKAWRDADPRHRTAFEEIRALWNDVEGCDAAFAPPAATNARHGRPLAQWRRHSGVAQRSAGAPRRRHLIAALGAACLAVLVAYAADLPTRFAADHRTAVGEQARVELPDGSIAYLNTDTAIALRYGDDEREVSLLRGEALFEVVEAPARPFAVLAQQGRATAVGTAFAVREDNGGATVTVASGTIEVASPDSVSGLVVGAGRQVRYAAGAPPSPADRVDVAAETAWREGAIVIDGLPLPQAIAEIDRYLPGKVILLADTSGLEPVTARLSTRTVDAGLRALADTHGLSVTQITDYLRLIR